MKKNISEETKKKHAEGISRSWKLRDAYHGMKNTKFYNSYRSMITRCNGTAGPDSVKKYKARGITVCDRWKGNFKNFYEDMFPTWKEGLTIGRIDNNGDYSPENCRWETYAQQSINKRNNRLVEYKGEQKTLIEWSNEVDVPYKTLKTRYYTSFLKGKHTIDEIMRKKLPKSSVLSDYDKNRIVYITFNGETKDLYGWAETLGITLAALRCRYYQKYLKGKKTLDEMMKK